MSGPRICVLLVREVAPLRYLHYKHEANKLWASTYLPIGQLLHMPSGLFCPGVILSGTERLPPGV
jgi:hypothetical protein